MHHSAVEDLSLQMALREKRYFKAAVQAGDHSPEACHQLKVLDSHGDQVLVLPARNHFLSQTLLPSPCHNEWPTGAGTQAYPLPASSQWGSITQLCIFCMLQVLELPEGAELLASSPTALNEIWTYQDRVLAIQGHPEMPCKEALHKILPFLSSNG